jgi:hypothetical protein
MTPIRTKCLTLALVLVVGGYACAKKSEPAVSPDAANTSSGGAGAGGNAGTGGATAISSSATGGNLASGGTSGATSTGGSIGSGGIGSGGKNASGGMTTAGGYTGTGGVPGLATGGAAGPGTRPASGGATGFDGGPSSGGAGGSIPSDGGPPPTGCACTNEQTSFDCLCSVFDCSKSLADYKLDGGATYRTRFEYADCQLEAILALDAGLSVQEIFDQTTGRMVGKLVTGVTSCPFGADGGSIYYLQAGRFPGANCPATKCIEGTSIGDCYRPDGGYPLY